MVESRNKAREEQLENTQNFLKELSSLNVTEREQKLEVSLIETLLKQCYTVKNLA